MKPLLLLLFLSLPVKLLVAQGCSDAGFCTMGAMKPDQTYTKGFDFRLNSIELNYYKGTASSGLSPKIRSVHAELTFAVNDKTNLQLKLPFQWVNGNIGETSSISDISVTATHRVYRTADFDIQASLGAKIPTNDSDLTTSNDSIISDGLSEAVLPMYYQTSLGSYDLIAGASLINSKWLVATGIQVPLTANDNTYDPEDFANYHDQNYIRTHDPDSSGLNGLKRGIDVMLRVERNFRFSNFNVGVGLLPIFRITKDQTKDPDTGEFEPIDGTTGMALSALFNAGYQININNSIKFIYGLKITDRKVNPDGLTRDSVISISYLFRF